MAVARGRWPVCKVMGQQPHIQLTYRRTPPRNGKWFRFFGHGDEVDFSPTVRRPRRRRLLTESGRPVALEKSERWRRYITMTQSRNALPRVDIDSPVPQASGAAVKAHLSKGRVAKLPV